MVKEVKQFIDEGKTPTERETLLAIFELLYFAYGKGWEKKNKSKK